MLHLKKMLNIGSSTSTYRVLVNLKSCEASTDVRIHYVTFKILCYNLLCCLSLF